MRLFTLLYNKLPSHKTGATLDVKALCYNCKNSFNIHITNACFNEILCSGCGNSVNQFTNACNFTVNPITKQIGHAVYTLENKRWELESTKGLLRSTKYIRFRSNILVHGVPLSGLSFISELRDYKTNTLLHSCKPLIAHARTFGRYRATSVFRQKWICEKPVLALDLTIKSKKNVTLYTAPEL
jgi:hypothetical protein